MWIEARDVMFGLAFWSSLKISLTDGDGKCDGFSIKKQENIQQSFGIRRES